MHHDSLFLETVRDLNERGQRPSEYDVVTSAGLLRKLLLDAPTLVDVVNRERRLDIRYVIKTEAGERVVVLPAALVEALVEWKARTSFSAPGDYVFATGQGGQDGRSNVTRRLLRPVIEAANVELVEAGVTAIEALTLHGLRRGAAILSEATGATASETAGQLGHKNPTITTGIYMVAMKHRARLSQAERAAFAEAIAWASMGTSAQSTGLELVPAPGAQSARPHS